MKNKIFILIIIIFVSIPQIVSASWYDFLNPFSWFEKEKVEFIVPTTIEETQQDTKQIETSDSKLQEPKVVEKTIIKEVIVPVEKVVEKIVSVPDQSVVNENIALKNKIEKLESKYNQCIASLNTAQSNSSTKQELINKMEKEIKEIENKISTLNEYGYICLMTESGSSSCQNNIKENERWPIVSQLEAQKLEIRAEISKLK